MGIQLDVTTMEMTIDGDKIAKIGNEPSYGLDVDLVDYKRANSYGKSL